MAIMLFFPVPCIPVELPVQLTTFSLIIESQLGTLKVLHHCTLQTVCYWHEPKPKWNETVKIQIPLDRFRDAHLRFIFRNRSGTDVKDKAEKPYALAYLKLMKVDSWS